MPEIEDPYSQYSRSRDQDYIYRNIKDDKSGKYVSTKLYLRKDTDNLGHPGCLDDFYNCNYCDQMHNITKCPYKIWYTKE